LKQYSARKACHRTGWQANRRVQITVRANQIVRQMGCVMMTFASHAPAIDRPLVLLHQIMQDQSNTKSSAK
ncbi:hypothetical protein ACUOGB_23110, partial [Escherichia coli]